ncbi:MAG: glycosyltransferase family 39 protein [Thermomicrobiales bacterium]
MVSRHGSAVPWQRAARTLVSSRSIVLGASMVSIAAWAFFAARDQTLIYYDAPIHQMIARRVFDSPTPGMGQSGSLWPALIHWLQLPLVWNGWLYRSGLSGSLLSMLAFALSAMLLFLLGRKITGSAWAGGLASLLFVLNPNVLYMQSTPMTDLPLTGCVIATVTAIVYWCEREDIRYLGAAILAVNIAAGTRYEGWFLWGCTLAVIVYVGLRNRWARKKIEDYALYFAVFGSAFMLFWVGWNAVINRDALGFLGGEYGASDNWVSTTDPTVGHLLVSVKTYWYATVDINGLPLVLTGILGLVWFTWRHRLDIRTCGLYLFLFPFVFYIPLLYTGTRPMHVPQITGDAYNVRFALHTTPLFVLMTAWLVWAIAQWIGAGRLRTLLMPLLVTAVALMAIRAPDISLQEPLEALDTTEVQVRQEAASWLKEHVKADPGVVLMQTVGNEQLLFWSDIPLDQVVYEGTTQDGQWAQELEQPSPDVAWIVMRCGGALGPDHVCTALGGPASPLFGQFSLAFDDGSIRIYQRMEPSHA